MSYHRPQDTYTHSNGSEFDARYQPGAYRDDPQNASEYYGSGGYNASPRPGGDSPAGMKQESQYEMEPQGTYGQYPNQAGAPYKDYSSSHQNLAAGGAPGANAQKYSYAPSKKPRSKWLKIGLPILLLLLIAIGVGVGVGVGVGGKSKSSSSSGSGSGNSQSTSGFSGATSGGETSYVPQSVLTSASTAASKGSGDDLTYQGTDPYGNPSFMSSANTATPASGGTQVGNCATDTFSGSLTNLRPHPRIMTTAAEWDCLPEKIANDAYLTVWNYTIFQNATAFYGMSPTNYTLDGGFSGSGILDPAREVQLRVKTFAYAYRMSGNDTKWAERAWLELQTAAGNNTDVVWGTGAPNGYIWNPGHFLDTAELTAAFAIGYDWLYDYWTPAQRLQLAWTIAVQGLQPGSNAYTTSALGADYRWWQTTNGNWNCVCNSGLLLGALALGTDDPSNQSASIIDYTLANMKGNCMQGAYDDGTWSETANYWYFGTAAQARAQSALTTATGSDQGLMAANTNWANTGYFHMFVSGMASMFFYGDNGPNKYSTTANGMFLWASYYKNPLYALFQRDRADAADPLSMFWYDTTTKGGFWNGMDLDRFFDNTLGSWASMRSSWTDFTGTYVAIKSSNATGHQAHGDLDAGDFVIDALGTRWAGEFGNGNYLSPNYFSNETVESTRWDYYRKSTQGQNTLVINKANQSPSCQPVNTFASSNTTQSNDIAFVPATDNVAYFKTDMSDAYGFTQGSNTVVRGIRMLNGRRQVLVQDEIAASTTITDINWRIHTNATVTLSSDNKTATLTISKITDPNAWGNTSDPLVATLAKTQTMIVKLLSPSSATFGTIKPDQSPGARIYGTNQAAVDGEDGDQVNPGVTLLYIDIAGGSQQTIQVVWQPQWSTMTTADSATPASVALADWSLTSHN
ncbi:hypothetical protein CBS101457_002681 [Exobasidium rhododendri]|nr:hypothetical protein CBS101457_002681 [Exobasidium rhododendri]